MAVTLKTTGLAALLVNAIAVHPETGLLTDFASSAVTSTMAVDPALVVSDDTWKGATRKKITLSTDITKHIAFGTNKPTFSLPANGSAEGVTYVFIGVVAGLNTFVIGTDANAYFAGRFTSGGTLAGAIRHGGVAAQGTAPSVTSGKVMFGFSVTPGVSNRAFFGTEASADLTIGDATALMPGNAGAISAPVSYLGRHPTSTAQEASGYLAYLKFGAALSDADLQTLHDDWFGVLFDATVEVDTTAPTLSSPIGTGGVGVCSGSVSTNEAAGTLYAVVTASATAPTAVQVEAGQDHTGAAALRVVSQAVTTTGAQSIASGAVAAGTRYAHYMHRDAAGNRSTVVSSTSFTVTAAGTASLTSSSLKNNTGTLLTAVAFEAYVNNPSTGALVIKKTGLTSNGSGVVTFTDAALTAATSYRVTWRRTDTGAEGLETLTAA